MNQLFSVPPPVVRIGRTPAVARANDGYLSGGTHLVLSLIFLCVVGLFASPARAVIPESERQVLIDIYNAMNGPNWTEQGGWMGPPGTECTWTGVHCVLDGDSYEDGPNVLFLWLGPTRDGTAFIGVQGSLPSLTGLTHLAALNMGGSSLENFPVALPPSLLYLMLSQCQLSGSIPDLSTLNMLEFIDLSFNELSGPIPSSLTSIESLWGIVLDYNQLTGEIPNLSGLVNLQTFGVGNNELTGHLPDISGLSSLQMFAANNNQLDGPMVVLPSSMVEFHAEYNQLTGEIPDLSGAVNINRLFLNNNQLTGISSFSGPRTPFNLVALSNNAFNEIPEDLGNVEVLLLDGNQISGGISVNSENILVLDVRGNPINGPIVELNTPLLQGFFAGSAGLTGEIPNLLSYPDVTDFFVDGNQLTGNLPDLSSLQRLSALFVNNNLLTGSVPSLPPQIGFFEARNNSLTGELPDFSTFPGIALFDVDNNQLTGSLPDLSVVTASNHQGEAGIYLSNNRFSGTIDSEISKNIHWLSLENNQLSGTIPDLDQLPSLELVAFANNRFVGDPPAITSMLRDRGQSTICPNQLNTVPDPDWDAATGVTPWYAGCFGADQIFTNGFDEAAL